MMTGWSSSQLDRIGKSRELEVSTKRPDGTFRDWTPIWVVCLGGDVYVRSWRRREGGWFGQAVRIPEARIRVPNLEAEVSVDDIGQGSAELRSAVDAAYRAKYGPHGHTSMVTDAAAATTLRLSRLPVRGARRAK
jgi:hypothetical protein